MISKLSTQKNDDADLRPASETEMNIQKRRNANSQLQKAAKNTNSSPNWKDVMLGIKKDQNDLLVPKVQQKNYRMSMKLSPKIPNCKDLLINSSVTFQKFNKVKQMTQVSQHIRQSKRIQSLKRKCLHDKMLHNQLQQNANVDNKDENAIQQNSARVETPREEKDYKYYLSKLKPYYLENIQLDENGDIIRQHSPTTVLQSFNPLPDKKIRKKMEYFYNPYS